MIQKSTKYCNFKFEPQIRQNGRLLYRKLFNSVKLVVFSSFFGWLLLVQRSDHGLREGEQGGQRPRGPWIFREPMGLKGPMRGPNGLYGAHRNETPKTFYFLLGDHLNLDRKTDSISVKTFFCFGDHLKIRRKVCRFPCLFWTAQNQRCVIFELSPGPPWLSAPLGQTITAIAAIPCFYMCAHVSDPGWRKAVVQDGFSFSLVVWCLPFTAYWHECLLC